MSDIISKIPKEEAVEAIFSKIITFFGSSTTQITLLSRDLSLHIGQISSSE